MRAHCQILPPHILDQIAKNGTPAQRQEALATLSIDATLRSLRQSVRAPRAVSQNAVGSQRRAVYSARNQQTLNGVLVRGEGAKPTGDPAADEAYDGLGATWGFFSAMYGRDSIDDDGMNLDAITHFSKAYNNAFWNGQMMVFGDGDGQLFNRFTISLDVVAHELTHGVTEDEAGLQYFNQSGALNESISDVFGSCVKQFILKQTARRADWVIGAGLFTANVNGVGLRSMKAPGTAYDDPVLGQDPQPAHVRDYVNTFSDNGGVHINSGILNHAFYRVAYALGRFSWEKAGRIWYDALRDPRLRPSANFRRFAEITRDVAGRLYGPTSRERDVVRSGWAAVGIQV